ncbi:MAG TPA: mechanosensitive ion channel domain-containing protein [Candidatus Acidoferrum sp.]|nr:mechanosensitive ion channel domain-containing protein [Candidatus Acidoferrum sp.]
MKSKQKIFAVLLVLLLGATAYGLFRTAQTAGEPRNNSTVRLATAEPATLVDQTPFLTARRLAQMPLSAEELPFAQEALRLGDKEMDLAFAAVVREAQEHPPQLSAEAKAIEVRLQKAERAVEADDAQVKQLTAEEGKASGQKKDSLDHQLDQAKAQLELDQDEVDDAKQDLVRAGGDPQSRIQTMVEEHEAASHVSDTTKLAVTAETEKQGLIHRFQRWSELHQKQLELWRAKEQAEALAASFSAKHSALEAEIAAGKSQSSGPGGSAAAPETVSGDAKGSTRNSEASRALLQATKRRSADARALTSFDKRVDDQKQLAAVYGNWIEVIAGKQRLVINRVLTGVAFILGILLIGLFFDSWLERLLGKTSLDRRQVETLRAVTRVAVQVFAVLFILLVIFGPPQQLGTFLGLAGAGLTVALKDFIIGFFGWFVLMGKNGIRLGDWVEINGVTGEVVELGMFHTVLLETGNWTDSGHPTGRRVTFTNSFAIEGHYFNFSTSGQWLWDELQVVLPPGQDPYPLVDALQKKVLEATAETAKQAEKEWKSAATSRQMSALSAAPAINVKPVVGGVEIAVRYITRANERYQLRAKLYQAAVDLLGGKIAQVPPPPEPAPASAPAPSTD